MEAEIGRGGMGEVWRAADDVLGRPVAVKLMLDGGADEQATARFRLEAQTAAKLNHPNVVTVFDFGFWNNRLYLVMELVDGESLAQVLAATGTLSPQRVADVAGQIAAGLAAAHRQGVIHRDIKPGNLMQDADGTVKIGDFGIARFVDEASTALTGAGQIVGTSLYLAPERALGRPAGPASDVYALGCVLYQLLVGEPPFQAGNAAALLHLHVTAPPTPPSLRRPELPGAFEEQLLRMLAKQPEDRPSAQDVADWFTSPAWREGAYRMPTSREAGTATEYALPRTTHQPITADRRHRAPQGQRPAALQARSTPARARALMRQHRRLTVAIAGLGVFVASTLLGMGLFSPDGGEPQLPGATPSPSADTSTTDPVPASREFTPSASPADTLGDEQEKGDEQEEGHGKQKQGHGEGHH
ncbi:serine/threonine-protein kinase [Streptomyces sp. NPDC048496]|uniref:serine/threonine-protein kinase n=1 Tax=Streptomyces sp. NPDC048496 TaxID=3365558 RepID=UPI00372142EE